MPTASAASTATTTSQTSASAERANSSVGTTSSGKSTELYWLFPLVVEASVAKPLTALLPVNLLYWPAEWELWWD